MNDRRLKRGIKIAYGTGDFGRAGYNTLRMFFYAIFLTDVVGLKASIASVAALIAIFWDAVNDPLVGILTDRARTRWGRRRPFFLWFSVPFGLSFLLLWWAPPWQTQAALALHVTAAFMLADTFQTLVSVPYLALGPEIAPGYDQRTSLMSWRMFFNLAASLIAAGTAPEIIDAALKAGMSLRQAYLLMGALFGGVAILPFLLLFVLIREHPPAEEPSKGQGFIPTLRIFLSNKPFVIAGSIYVLNWICFDLLALMLPYYLLYWLSRGNLLARVELFGVGLAPETAAFGILLMTAIITLPFWNFLSGRTSKRKAYIIGMSVWALVQCIIWTIPEGRLLSSLWIAAVAGFTTSSAHVLPESMFPEALDWDELRSGKRREGLYYGAITFVRKLATALATFIALQVLSAAGYLSPPEGSLVFHQSAKTVTAIRFLTGPGVLLIILPTILLTVLLPMDRAKQERIQSLLEKRRERRAGKALPPGP
ncbi:MAG: MFS transporter [Spirochaetales bacterium]|nr:MFS transporter [Spirochaetales bacterium]